MIHCWQPSTLLSWLHVVKTQAAAGLWQYYGSLWDINFFIFNLQTKITVRRHYQLFAPTSLFQLRLGFSKLETMAHRLTLLTLVRRGILPLDISYSMHRIRGVGTEFWKDCGLQFCPCWLVLDVYSLSKQYIHTSLFLSLSGRWAWWVKGIYDDPHEKGRRIAPKLPR